jgi:hypothetical protein
MVASVLLRVPAGDNVLGDARLCPEDSTRETVDEPLLLIKTRG